MIELSGVAVYGYDYVLFQFIKLYSLKIKLGIVLDLIKSTRFGTIVVELATMFATIFTEVARKP